MVARQLPAAERACTAAHPQLPGSILGPDPPPCQPPAPPKADAVAGCGTACDGGPVVHQLAVGEVVVGYTIGRTASGQEGCAVSIEFQTTAGSTYTCDASARRRGGGAVGPFDGVGGGNLTTAAARGASALRAGVARPVVGRAALPPRFFTQEKAPRNVPQCLKKRTKPAVPFGELCTMKKFTCSGGGSELGKFTPEWVRGFCAHLSRRDAHVCMCVLEKGASR